MPVPVFVRVMFLVIDEVLTGWLPNVVLAGVMFAPAWTPVPASDTG